MIGATGAGIGAIYELAKQEGFRTSGIVSTQARDNQVKLAPCADTAFFVEVGRVHAGDDHPLADFNRKGREQGRAQPLAAARLPGTS